MRTKSKKLEQRDSAVNIFLEVPREVSTSYLFLSKSMELFLKPVRKYCGSSSGTVNQISDF